jgi:TolB-like protein/DNA-binding winged helix-turn-helix (wHTH) protein
MPQHQVVRFGPFAADLRAGEVHKHGTKLRLHGQPVQVLGLLLERPGDVVTREELRARLWDSETFVDFEHGLHAAVNKLRVALNDAADHPRFIETIPRRGYRFIGTIESSEQSPEAPSLTAEARREPASAPPLIPPPPIAPSFSWHRASPVAYALAILLLLALVAVLWSYRATTDSASGSDSRLMLAVLPFENLSTDAEQEYFSDGLTEELITGLGQLDAARLGVIARTSVMGYKRTTKRVREISGELGVDYVLEGTVRRADARIRVAAQLIRAGDETHVWAGSYDRTPGDLLSIQIEMARAVAGELQLRLPGADRRGPTSRRPITWEAHESVLRGRHFLEQRTAHGNRLAREYFERAIALEPTYIPAPRSRRRAPSCDHLR